MKKFAIIGFLSLLAAGCASTPAPQVSNANTGSVNAANARKPEDSLVATSHSTEKSATPVSPVQNASPGAKKKWTQSGTPIDTAELDAEIAQAEKALKAKPQDAAAKKNLAAAFVKRGIALTEARQYASALGDYRRAQKFEPQNPEAKRWIDEIVNIYGSLNREYPKEGEEPPPLPFEKKS